ncbi:MAG: hypothetical protein AAGH15_24450 [Myxococcota bacterium]
MLLAIALAGCEGEAPRWEGAYLGQLSRSARFRVEGELHVRGGGADGAELRIARDGERYRLELPGCTALADAEGARLHVDPRTQCACEATEASAEATVAGRVTRDEGRVRVELTGTTEEGTCDWRFVQR